MVGESFKVMLISCFVIGELAVNPGLAAIWKEEQERLQKDVLESSQRPLPQRTMSEILLMDKLLKNLRFEVRNSLFNKNTTFK